MQTQVQPGCNLTLTAPYARDSGQGAKVGKIFGVAFSDVANAAEGVFVTEGVHYLAKATGAWTQGDPIYWDDSAKNCSGDSAAGMLIGVATADAESGDASGYVKLNGTASDMSEGAQAAEADLSGTLTGTANGSMVDVAATAGSCAGGWTPTAGNVDTAIATAVASIVTGVNEQNKELLTKVNALLAKLRLAGILDA